MIISKNTLKNNKPKDHFILALLNNSIYCEDNTYIPKWVVVQSDYYLRNKNKFEGWIELPEKSILSKKKPIELKRDGYVNCLLGFLREKQRYKDRHPHWGIINVAYYLKHREEFEGWIGLEFLIPKLRAGGAIG